MTLIKSISGIRGTIGGFSSTNLTPVDLVQITSGYARWLKDSSKHPLVVVGRDGRKSGSAVSGIVMNTLILCGIDVIDLGLTTTPTVEVAVIEENAQGGIIFSASHNPMNWNALKLLNEKGEFLTADQGKAVLDHSEETFEYAMIDEIGSISHSMNYPGRHIELICNLEEVEVEAIKHSNFTVVVDAVNSTGALTIPPLLEALGVKCILINGEISGKFAHNPEPLEKHLEDLITEVKLHDADLGIAVDPDVDRLALVDENGKYFGEEYTLVAVADYLLKSKKGPVVSNLSSTGALRDVAEKYGCECFYAAVGEANVVKKMKEVNAVLGGEGNGGVIFPGLHYGRDALVGIAFILSSMASSSKKASQLRSVLPDYHISKHKFNFTENISADEILTKFSATLSGEKVDNTDGIKIYLEKEWVHLRKSNTEPIIRVYAESKNELKADNLAEEYIEKLESIIE